MRPPLPFFLSILLLVLAGRLPAADPANPPAQVVNPVSEAALPELRLTAQAVQRLGIASALIERKAHARTRLFPGTVRLPLGAADDVLAPAPVSGPEELRKLAELQNTADGAIASAKAALEAATTDRQRAEALATAKAGSGRALDDAKAAEAQAEAALLTATQARALLGKPAAAAAAAPQRWIAVALAATDTARIDLAQPALVRSPGDGQTGGRPAVLAARPATSLVGGSVEVFFALDDGRLPIGQQVEVELAGNAAPDADQLVLTVPWSAIVYDATGGAWVYEQREATVFLRRRVGVLRVVGGEALLSAGPEAGTKIVTTGVAELFGTEFGGFK